jgi:enamine deaminase RidA (YjgF/YER057c/UK114 family)
MAELRPVNPWRWQDPLDFSQGVVVHAAQRQLLCAGQTAVDGEGRAQHAGDMPAQLELAFDNLEKVLAAAGMSMLNVARLNYYVTDLPAFFAASPVVSRRLHGLRTKPAGTLLGVAALHQPGLMVEIEATAFD